MNKEIVFLCGARDFHAMDWYRSAKSLFPNHNISILTDLIEAEGYKKLVRSDDSVFKLLIIDQFLFKNQSKIGHIWRNIVKILVFPIQIILAKRFFKSHPNTIFHAHSMYYLFLAWASNIPFIGTPQGSDILIKPFKSKIYRYFAIKSLLAARSVTVDSTVMKEKIKLLCDIDAEIIQNGVDIKAIGNFLSSIKLVENPKTILSIRGITTLYRIKEILLSRNNLANALHTPISFIYPFSDSEYLKEIKDFFLPTDNIIGRVDRLKMYELLSSSMLVISIPSSDSSPRSVYEAIFCGAIVAITYHPYYDLLPECMKSRIIVADLNDILWLEKAIKQAEKIRKRPFIPSEEALDMFDQERSFIKMMQLFN